MRNANIQSASSPQMNHVQGAAIVSPVKLELPGKHAFLNQITSTCCRHAEGNESVQLLPPKVQNSILDKVKI